MLLSLRVSMLNKGKSIEFGDKDFYTFKTYNKPV